MSANCRPIERSTSSRIAAALAVFCAVLCAAPAFGVTQTVTLKPGWNSIYVEVQPENPDLSHLLSATSVESVWSHENKGNAPDFVQEVTEEALTKMGWISWVQTNRVDSFQNDLFQFQVNRAYLVKNGGATDVSVALSGRPSLRTPRWQPNAWNFLGFPVDPAFSPTFLSFFKPSPAHYSAAAGLGQIYKLNGGSWQLAGASDLMKSGEAYWVFCKGNSDYAAPLSAGVDAQDGLGFAAVVDEVELTIQNFNDTSLNATFTDVNGPAANPLIYAEIVENGTLTWPAFTPPLVRSVAAKGKRVERIGVRRSLLASGSFETTLQVIDGAGTRLLIPVTVTGQANAPVASAFALAASSAPHVGLWLGAVSLNAVSEAHSGTLVTNESANFTTSLETNSSGVITTNKVPNSVSRVDVSMAATPTGGEFNLRVLVHVDASGQARLLKEVIQMWKNGTSTNDPGRIVLVTDDSLINQFVGINSRDGVNTGRRVSSVGFDFPQTELLMGGSFDEGSSVATTNTMSASFPRNPFRHKYHPDHREGLSIKRVIELAVGSAPTNAPPGYGDRILQGAYKETISGLHRTNIVVTGPVRFTRLSTVATLNQ